MENLENITKFGKIMHIVEIVLFSALTIFALAVLHLVFTGMIIKKCKTQNNNVTNNA